VGGERAGGERGGRRARGRRACGRRACGRRACGRGVAGACATSDERTAARAVARASGERMAGTGSGAGKVRRGGWSEKRGAAQHEQKMFSDLIPARGFVAVAHAGESSDGCQDGQGHHVHICDCEAAAPCARNRLRSHPRPPFALAARPTRAPRSEAAPVRHLEIR